jgi:hypothetical protein
MQSVQGELASAQASIAALPDVGTYIAALGPASAAHTALPPTLFTDLQGQVQGFSDSIQQVLLICHLALHPILSCHPSGPYAASCATLPAACLGVPMLQEDASGKGTSAACSASFRLRPIYSRGTWQCADALSCRLPNQAIASANATVGQDVGTFTDKANAIHNQTLDQLTTYRAQYQPQVYHYDRM